MNTLHHIGFTIIFFVLVQSCTTHEELFFVRDNGFAQYSLSLQKNGAFRYSSDGEGSTGFNEIGTYEFLDTVLILDYMYESYSYNCITVPLVSDTFLLAEFNNTVFLYPVKQVKQNKVYTYKDMIESLCVLYKTGRIGQPIGVDFLKIEKKEFETMFGKRTHSVTEYFEKICQ